VFVGGADGLTIVPTNRLDQKQGKKILAEYGQGKCKMKSNHSTGSNDCRPASYPFYTYHTHT